MKWFAKRCVFFSLALFGLNMILQAQAVAPLDGIWLGTIKVPGIELRIALTFSQDENGYKATMNSLDQGSGELPMQTVEFENNHLLVQAPNLGIEIEGDADFANNVLNTEFRQGQAKLPLQFNKVDALPVGERPQEPKRPFPYNEEEVSFKNETAGVTIAGTLTTPKSAGPFPAVILLSGSGAQNRDEELFGHKPFLVLSDYLTRLGIAVLRCDDRGVGGTTAVNESTTGDFAQDALAGIEFLKNRPEINPSQIGLVGHSEGGMVACIAAAQSSDVAFIVLMAAPGIQFDDIILFQKEIMWQRAGMSQDYMEIQRNWHNTLTKIALEDISNDEVEKKIKAAYEALSEDEKARLKRTPEILDAEIKWTTNPWHRYAAKYDAAATLSKVKCPVLALDGSKDMQVSAKENLAVIQKALESSGHQNYEVKELDGLNHLFQTADTGAETEYIKIEETMSPIAMKIIGDWILQQTGIEQQ